MTTKVKGLGYTVKSANPSNSSYMEYEISAEKIRIFDVNTFKSTISHGFEINFLFCFNFKPADYVVPAAEYNSIFIMTNYIETKQEQGVCEEVNKGIVFWLIGCKLNSVFLSIKDYRNIQASCHRDEDCLVYGKVTNG